jgi:branched-chain amino acid transport system permease protein
MAFDEILNLVVTRLATVDGIVGIVVGGLTFGLVMWALRNERRIAVDTGIHVFVALLGGLFVGGLAAQAVLAPIFFVEVALSGLLAGVMYSLVALGFVLIFKASGIFNFAQGVMALFAGLTLVGLMSGTVPFKHIDIAANGLPAWLAIPATIGIMILLAILIERLVLRHLVNQEHIILFMATLGLAYVLEGLGDTIWGADVKVVPLNLPSGASDWLLDNAGIYVEKLEVFAAVVAALLVLVLAIFFQKTRIGRALRAVADDHQAALSVGISLRTIWIIVWSVAGIVALVAGVMWGAKSGIQFSLSEIALKALPVLILGGFESIPGAIIGGLIIGMSEKLAEVFFGSMVGGAIENWFAFALALLFLLVRPQGLFGERIIERV